MTFAQAATVLLDPLALTVFDATHSEAKERWFTLGMSGEQRLLAISHSHQPIGPTSVTVCVSSRHAKRRAANASSMKMNRDR